jgi:hypothetical protein
MNKNNVIEVAESLYREKNPRSKMDTPSFAYETVEKWKNEWMVSKSPLLLYDWIKFNKNKDY